MQVCDSSKVRRNAAGVPIEAELTAHVVHSNLVRTIDTASAYRDTTPKPDWEIGQDKAREEAAAARGEAANTTDTTASSSGQPAAPVEETWLLLEYCDQGTLIVSFLSHSSCCCTERGLHTWA